MVVGVDACHTGCFCRWHVGYALNRAEVEFAILERAVWGNKLERVNTKAGDTADGGRDASRAEEVEKCVGALRMVNMEIPKLEESAEATK
jgi:hypothetical protein